MNGTEKRSQEEKTLQMWSMIFDKDAKTIQWGKDNLFISWCWENCMHMENSVEPLPYAIYQN